MQPLDVLDLQVVALYHLLHLLGPRLHRRHRVHRVLRRGGRAAGGRRLDAQLAAGGAAAGVRAERHEHKSSGVTPSAHRQTSAPPPPPTHWTHLHALHGKRGLLDVELLVVQLIPLRLVQPLLLEHLQEDGQAAHYTVFRQTQRRQHAADDGGRIGGGTSSGSGGGGRTTSARRLAASCAGPGRARLMASLCLTSCSSSLRIFSSRLQVAVEARQKAVSVGGRVVCAGTRDQGACSMRSRVSPSVQLVDGVIERGRRLLLLLLTKQTPHGVKMLTITVFLGRSDRACSCTLYCPAGAAAGCAAAAGPRTISIDFHSVIQVRDAWGMPRGVARGLIG